MVGHGSILIITSREEESVFANVRNRPNSYFEYKKDNPGFFLLLILLQTSFLVFPRKLDENETPLPNPLRTFPMRGALWGQVGVSAMCKALHKQTGDEH